MTQQKKDENTKTKPRNERKIKEKERK